MSLTRRGMILILSSPSGAGKTTLTRMLLQDKSLDLTLSISVTTRARRSSEADGIHYHFIDRRRYDTMKTGGELLEAAEVHGNGYGTPRKPVEDVLAQLAAVEGEVPARLTRAIAAQGKPEAIPTDEESFRFLLNEDAMASDKLAEGIRAFVADSRKLDALIEMQRPRR